MQKAININAIIMSKELKEEAVSSGLIKHQAVTAPG
jgi:hypothetical protein